MENLLVLLFLYLVFGALVPALPREYQSRTCAGRRWRRAFPGCGKSAIRRFLWCFTDGMSFQVSDGLKFGPEDRVFDVYRAIYGGRVPFGDDMECERFAENMSMTFQRPVRDVDALFHADVTLGELFRGVARPRRG